MIVALIVVLAVSAVMDLALGVWASAFWESYRQTWFMNPAFADGRELQLLGLVLGLILIFFAALQFDSIRAIRRGREGVYRFPIFFGGYLLASSIVTFLVIQGWDPKVMPLGGLEFLVTDGLRGGCLVALGILAMRAPATVTELRLPKPESMGMEHAPEGSRDREPWRKRERERGGRNRSDRSGSRRGAGRRSAESSHQPQQPRQQQPPRPQQRSSGSAESVRSSAPEAAKDRSLSVVVRGDFRSGSDRGPSSADNDGNESTGREGRRRRRRRGSTAQRSERGSDSNESTNGAGMERANARADMTSAPFGSKPVQENGLIPGGAEARPNEARSASRPIEQRDVVDLVSPSGEGLERPKGSDSSFGRNRRSGGPRRR